MHIDSALSGVPIDDRCKCKAWTQAIQTEGIKSLVKAKAEPSSLPSEAEAK